MKHGKINYTFISQVVRNAFNIESAYLTFPYTNLQQIDHGFRELVWSDYDMATDLPSYSLPSDHYTIHVTKSVLEFVNIACVVSLEENPDVIVFGPFSSELLSEPRIRQIISRNRLSPQHLDTVTHFYRQLPTAAVSNVLTTVQYLITAFLPDFSDAEIIYQSFSKTSHEAQTGNERHALYSTQAAELYNRHIQEYLNAVAGGDVGQAVSLLKSLLPYISPLPNAALATQKKEFAALNQFCCQRILTTTVHPYYVFEQMALTDDAIEHAAAREQLVNIAHQLTHKYCLLVKNYALSEYSFLVRSIINYIDQNIAEPLNLSTIAAYFNRNASYVSGLFNKEMGCSLTTFIHQERIRRAIRYMNTTELSISEIAHAVGIDDFAYFSRIFKKEIGKSPSEYRKMLRM